MGRVIHFEIHAENPERAVKFYETMFGWKCTKWGGPMDYWLVSTGPDSAPGINGGLLKRRGPSPAPDAPCSAFPCTISVDNLKNTLAELPAAGGVEVVPTMAVPGIGWLAYGHDTENNVFGMMQEDPGAA